MDKRPLHTKTQVLRRAANYASYKTFVAKEPHFYESVKRRGWGTEIMQMFKDRTIYEHKAEPKGPDRRLRENRTGPTINRRMILEEAKRHKSLADFRRRAVHFTEVADRLGLQDTLAVFFSRNLFIDEVLQEAAKLPSWEDFQRERPRYCVAAGKLGLRGVLQEYYDIKTLPPARKREHRPPNEVIFKRALDFKDMFAFMEACPDLVLLAYERKLDVKIDTLLQKAA